MNEVAKAVIARCLAPDESLIWHGQPPQGFRLRAIDLPVSLLGLLLCGFAVYWAAFPVTGIGWFLRVAPCVVTAACGLYLAAGRFIVDQRFRARTHYVLTDQRVLIVSGLVSTTVDAIELSSLAQVLYQRRTDGTGTLFFEEPKSAWAMWAGGALQGPGTVPRHWYQSPCFDWLEDGKAVHQLVLSARDAAIAKKAITEA